MASFSPARYISLSFFLSHLLIDALLHSLVKAVETGGVGGGSRIDLLPLKVRCTYRDGCFLNRSQFYLFRPSPSALLQQVLEPLVLLQLADDLLGEAGQLFLIAVAFRGVR